MAKNLFNDIESISRAPKRFYNGCVGKKKFPSRRLALATRRVMGKSDELQAYKCQFCKAWHLGH